MKKAIRYHRFSKNGQSNSSIERQEVVTDHWLLYNDVELIDTFTDRGYSARTFDRPDFIKLQEFVKKHHRHVDYLIVDQLDRFSRVADEALSMIKQLQHKFNIQIVSITEGITYDYNTPGSYFRTGLQLLLAEEDNINRSIKVRSGLYAAKTKEGRYVYKNPPYGYIKEGERKDRKLVIYEREALVVKFIFEAFLKDVPLYVIREKANQLGFNKKANGAIERILEHAAYAGLLRVKPFREHPGGIFPGNHEAIVDLHTWKMVQEKRKKADKPRVVFEAEIPLRGALKCHCGNLLTGAPSRGKMGKYYYYYKCRFSKHNNISAKKAHEQLEGAFGLMSLKPSMVAKIRERSQLEMEKSYHSNKEQLKAKKEELRNQEQKLHGLEEKWISDEISKDTYDRWYYVFKDSCLNLEAAIERLSMDYSYGYKLLDKNLDKLTDVKHFYQISEIEDKQQLVNLVFDSNLYYKEGIYRTPTMMGVFTHNTQKMREKGLLIYEKEREGNDTFSFSGE